MTERIYGLTDEWWKDSTPETLKKEMERLISHGVDKDIAFDVIENVYYAVRNEYGD